MTNESIPIASSKAGISASQGTDARTRVLLHGPIVLTLLRLGPPNVVVNVVLIAVTASVDAHFIGRFEFLMLSGRAILSSMTDRAFAAASLTAPPTRWSGFI